MKTENFQNNTSEKSAYSSGMASGQASLKLSGQFSGQPSETETSSNVEASHFALGTGSSNWQRFVCRPRIDLSNLEEIQTWTKELQERGERWLVLDLKGTRFMSLPVIRFLEILSEDLLKSGGALALASMPDKTHRIFEIYGSLKNIFLVEKLEGLKALQASLMNPFFRVKKF